MTESTSLAWLRVGASACILTGVAMALLPLASDTSLPDSVFALVQRTGSDPGAATPAARLATAIAGAVLAGWGVMLHGLAHSGADRHTMSRAATRGIVLWFLLDSGMSIATGFAWNAVLNLSFLALLLPPLALLGRSRAQPGATAATCRTT